MDQRGLVRGWKKEVSAVVPGVVIVSLFLIIRKLDTPTSNTHPHTPHTHTNTHTPECEEQKLWIVFQPAVYLLPRVILNICLLESILKTTSVNLPTLVILMALALVVSYSLMVATMFA